VISGLCGEIKFNMYNFKEQVKLDWVKEAEKRCLDYLLSYGLDAILVADDPNFYADGIDIIIREPGGEVNIDVKADKALSKTGNFFFELIEIFWKHRSENIKNGWLLNGKLDYIYYVDVVDWVLYIIKSEEMYSYVYSGDKFKCRLIPHENYKTIGFLVPLEEVNSIYKKVDLKFIHK